MTKHVKPDTGETSSPKKNTAVMFSFFKQNGNSTKYNWNEGFVKSVCDKMLKWFRSDTNSYDYEIFLLDSLQLLIDPAIEKLEEFPNIWKNYKGTLDKLVHDKVWKMMAAGKISQKAGEMFLQNAGRKWKEERNINLNSKSLEETIDEAYRSTDSKKKKDIEMIAIEDEINKIIETNETESNKGIPCRI